MQRLVEPYLIKSRKRMHNHSMLLHCIQHILIHNVLAPSSFVKVKPFTKPFSLNSGLIHNITFGRHIDKVVTFFPFDSSGCQVLFYIILK